MNEIYASSYFKPGGNTIANLVGITPDQDGAIYNAVSYYNEWVSASGVPMIGGVFEFQKTRLKSEHNGTTIISPTVPWNGETATVAAFEAATGETDVFGSGCWVAVNPASMSGGSYMPPSVVSETSVTVTTTATINDASYSVFASQACTELVFYNFTNVEIEYQRNGAGNTVIVKPGQTRRITGITDANQIGVRRVDNQSGISRPTVVTMRAVTSTEDFDFAGTLSVTISSGGGNTQLGAQACTSLELINTMGKMIQWRIGTVAPYQRLKESETVVVQGITNANQVYVKPYDSVASFIRPLQVECFTSGLTYPLGLNRQMTQLSSDARVIMDFVNYPALWPTTNWLSISEQNSTRSSLIKSDALELAVFPTVATSTLSQPAACADATTGEILFGTSALEYTQTVANSNALFAPAAAAAVGLDVTGKDIHFDYSFPDNAGVNYSATGNLALFQIHLFSAGTPAAPGANYHSVTIAQTATNFMRVDLLSGGQIVSNSVPVADFAAVGAGANLAAITWARFSLTGGNGAGVNGAKFRPVGIYVAPKARAKAAVVFLFDDLHIGQYTNALPILSKYKYPACIGIDTVSKAGQTGFMTPAQIQTLHQRHGWQVVGQVTGGDGASTTTDTAVAIEQAIAQGARYKTAMKMLGIGDTEDFSRGSTSFHSNSGPYYPNWNVLKRLARTSVEFLGGNNANPPFTLGETVPFGDPYSIKRVNMSGFTATTWATRWQNHIDQAIANLGVAIFGAHSEFNSAGEGLTALQTTVDYIRTQELLGNVEVLTLAQLIKSAY